MNEPSRIVTAVFAAVSEFGRKVTPRFAPGIAGEPEDKLRGPMEALLASVGTVLDLKLTMAGEAAHATLGLRSDYAVYVDGVLTGHLELKAPGKGADPDQFRGHDCEQWKKSRRLPNLLYSDGNAWALYRHGELIDKRVTLVGDVRWAGEDLAPPDDQLSRILTDFVRWKPVPPRSAADLAQALAGLCRLLRDEVMDVLAAEELSPQLVAHPFTELLSDWKELLFPDATNARFADSYAQTVTFALLLARSEGEDVSDIEAAARGLGKQHGLLGRALQVLADDAARALVATSVGILQRVIGSVKWELLTPAEQQILPGFEKGSGKVDNPWLYFYEDFLAAYDPELRKAAGAYYTPPEVVAAQVRFADDVLRSRLGKKLGLADDNVVIVDPAMGAGSYILRVIEDAALSVAEREGVGAVPGRLHSLATRLIGFEIMTGPYAVAEMQVTEAFRRHEADIPADGLRLYLADTLSDPYTEEAHLGGLYEPIARSRRAADKVKKEERVLVCLGNPPYDRHRPGEGLGGWVRYGHPAAGQTPILDAFRTGDIRPGHMTSLYNMYVYFWRWALWKVFEAHPDSTSGVVAFITSSSFLGGPGFAAMRETMRRVGDEIWVLDLGGEGHGARKEENVFAIQTPVAITVCARKGPVDAETPATIKYARISGSRSEKLSLLRKMAVPQSQPITEALDWEEVSTGWRDSFIGRSSVAWDALPPLFDLIPWRVPGVKVKRTWPISPSEDCLRERWNTFGASPAERRPELFKEDVHRTLKTVTQPLPGQAKPNPATLGEADVGPCPPVVRYGWRSFDRRWILADSRLMGQPTPSLWRVHTPSQLYLTTLHAGILGGGPGLIATNHIPDFHHFSGRGGGALPLWRDSKSTQPNVAPGLLEMLSNSYGFVVSGPMFFAYVAAVLGHSGYTERYRIDLATPGPRVPLTKDAGVFQRAVDCGSEILWLHTYGSNYTCPESGRLFGQIPNGLARIVKAIPPGEEGMPSEVHYDRESEVLHLGAGEIGPVSEKVWEYQVSGLQVVRKYLGSRLRRPSGRKSSPLNLVVPVSWTPAWTSELLEMLWVVERLVSLEGKQDDLLGCICEGSVFTVAELTTAGILPIPTSARQPQKARKVRQAEELVGPDQ